MDTSAKLKEIFEAYFMQPMDGFDDATTSAQIPKWDSTAHVGLILAIERRFDLEFTPSELSHMTSVGSIRALLDRKLLLSSM